MKVGDYVRTKDGRISKIASIDSNSLYSLEDYNYKYKQDWLVKSSPNIIDLIEVGDYVNGYRVESVDTEYAPYGVYIEIPFVDSESIGCNMDLIRTEEIESIVTKEQFESMEYKVGDKE